MDILFIASMVTAITTIVTGVWKIIRLVNKIMDKCEEYDEMIKENTMYTLKLVILSDELHLEERIRAGDRYVALGGNGYVKQVYLKLLEEVEVDVTGIH